MDWPEVERHIAAGEDARTEFKRGVNELRGIGRTLCAFANGDGGLIVLGVEDAPRAIVGMEADPEAVQERVTSLLHTEACALWGFRGRPVEAGRPGRAREGVRRGAIEPEEGPKTPHRAFMQEQHAPVRATRTSRPPAFAGAGSGPRDRTGTDGSVTSRSAGVDPKPAPAKAGGTGPYNERIRSGRPART